MKKLIFSLIVLTFFVSCKKESLDMQSLKLNIQHQVGDEPLKLNQYLYTNRSGEKFEVTKLNYYISEIQLLKDEKVIFVKDSLWYTSLSGAQTDQQISLPEAPVGRFDAVQFTFGLPDQWNAEDKVPLDQFRAMVWPAHMGGGLHFMKFEGNYFKAPQGEEEANGFAIHSGNLLKDGVVHDHFFTVHVPIASSTEATREVNLVFDVSKWVDQPAQAYPFAELSGIMGSVEKQAILVKHGPTAWREK
ncbi:MbnP family protein [Persicobacter psychrovividus]|uniref:Copper-binding protein MbnP-like domain-containing protein n=1 Tax=Persicobacter psychrovividus TaxID=387638 RepID=A0ABN6L5G9_9BACT|nr:hypothetical protein PEPS_06630 [Persicobacter psychrovividus]